MNLLTELLQPPSSSVGRESGDVLAGGLAALEVPKQDMRFCEICDCEQIFCAGWETFDGLMGCCLGCGEERVIPFSRTNSEAA